MAEFLNQPKPERPVFDEDSGMNAMGKPVPFYRQEAAYKTCKEIGLDTEDAHDAVSAMAEAIRRDEPYTAMEAGMRYIDLTGTYRILAVLCTAEDVNHTTDKEESHANLN